MVNSDDLAMKVDRNEIVQMLASQYHDKASVNLDSLPVDEVAGFYRQADKHIELLNAANRLTWDQACALALIAVITKDEGAMQNPYRDSE